MSCVVLIHTCFLGLLVFVVNATDPTWNPDSKIDVLGAEGTQLVEEKKFSLNSTEMYHLQRYVKDVKGFSVPTSIMTSALDKELLTESTKWKNRATEWDSTSFPKTVKTASDLYDFANTVVLGIRFIRTYALDAKMIPYINSVFNLLSTKALTYKKNTDDTFKVVQKQKSDVELDKTSATTISGKYEAAANDANGDISRLRKELSNLRAEVKQLTEDYEQAVIIAATTVTYAWIPFYGWIIGPTIAGVYGAKAEDYRKRRAVALKSITTTQAELTTEISKEKFANDQGTSLDSLVDVFAWALPVFQKMAGYWGSVRDDVANVYDTQMSPDKAQAIFEFFSTIVLEDKWAQIGLSADWYRDRAYVTLDA